MPLIAVLVGSSVNDLRLAGISDAARLLRVVDEVLDADGDPRLRVLPSVLESNPPSGDAA